MISAVDTNVLFDVIYEDQDYVEQSLELLSRAYDSGSLIICDIVCAELSGRFHSQSDLAATLGKLNVNIVESGFDVAWMTGRKWAEYRASGGSRERVLPDFIIGAHAALRADCLLTRDRGFYKTYFPELKLVDCADSID